MRCHELSSSRTAARVLLVIDQSVLGKYVKLALNHVTYLGCGQTATHCCAIFTSAGC